MIKDPEYPKDRTKARALTPEQAELVMDDIKAMMNASMSARRGTNSVAAVEANIIRKLADAGLPIRFGEAQECGEHEGMSSNGPSMG